MANFKLGRLHMTHSVTRRALALLVIGLCLALTAETVVLAAAVKRNGGAVTAVRTAVNPGYDNWTQSATPTDVVGMSVTVKVPAGERALLVATFSATSVCDGGCFVRAVVGSTTLTPDLAIVDSPDRHVPMSRQWVSAVLNPGEYTVKIQYWVGDSDGNIFILKDRILTVLRSKVV